MTWEKRIWPLVIIITMIVFGYAGFIYCLGAVPMFAKQFLWMSQLGIILFGWWAIDRWILHDIDTIGEIQSGNVAMAITFAAYAILAGLLVGQV